MPEGTNKVSTPPHTNKLRASTKAMLHLHEKEFNLIELPILSKETNPDCKPTVETSGHTCSTLNTPAHQKQRQVS
jgi:hypothetical protein